MWSFRKLADGLRKLARQLKQSFEHVMLCLTLNTIRNINFDMEAHLCMFVSKGIVRQRSMGIAKRPFCAIVPYLVT